MPARKLGKFELLARERNVRDLALAAQPGGHPRGLWFDAAAGDRVVQFIERYCKHYKGQWAGQPLLLEEWAKEHVVRPLFGWKRADGTRRFRTAWEELARKNGKTTKAAGGALYMLAGDQEPGAEVYCTATKEDQAKILHDDATKMVKSSDGLKKFIKPFRKNLFCERLYSKFMPLGADSDTLDGFNPHAHFPDEVHAHKDPGVWEKMDTGMGARRQPLTWAITTAGIYDPTSIGCRKHEYATQVLEGTFEDDSFFAYICAVDDEDDPYEPENWGKANPQLGLSITTEFMEGQALKAKREPGFYNTFLQLHLNRWTQQITRWISPEAWKASDPVTTERALEVRHEHEEELAGRECFAGLDLSSRLDLTALVLLFPGLDDMLDVLCRFWLPEDRVAECERKGERHYAQWVREGWVRTTPGGTIDYAFIRAEANELAKKYRVKQWAYDPYGAEQLAVQMGETDGHEMVEVRQGFLSLSEPSKDFEARVASKKIRHRGNPVLAWCVGNAVVKRDSAGNIKPDKDKAKGKVDGLSAFLDAHSRLIVTPSEQGGSSYLATGPLISF